MLGGSKDAACGAEQQKDNDGMRDDSQKVVQGQLIASGGGVNGVVVG